MRNELTNSKNKEQGSAMLITTIILLILMVIVATTISISGMQFDLAMLNRNTSNTYYLAKSAVEKQVDTMNKAVESQLTKIIKDVNTDYIAKLMSKDASIKYGSDKITVDDATIRGMLQTEIYNYLKRSYKTKTVSDPTAQDPIIYTVQSDRVEDGYYTEIKITIAVEDATGAPIAAPNLRIIATATTKSTVSPSTIYDQQTVEGIMDVKLPAIVDNQIHERYDFVSTPPEVLNSAILCFSDVVVSGAGRLNVTAGDVRVSGQQIISGYTSGSTTKYPEADQNGGVIAINGGQINITDNLYCANNVLATNGWVETDFTDPSNPKRTYNGTTKINVGGDIIAYTVGIVDDYYDQSGNQSPFNTANQVTNATIVSNRNIMVDNDVMIDRWVNSCSITAKDTIFGVNAGVDDSGNYDAMIDPNQSSGIFSQGEGSFIEAERMYVAGQPYITLASNQKPLKLWESIGEPFNGIASFEGYKNFQEKNTNKDYVLDTSPFHKLIKTNKIITDFNNTYAFASVSGKNKTASGTFIDGQEYAGATCNSIFSTNQATAVKFFYQGLTGTDATNSDYFFNKFMKTRTDDPSISSDDAAYTAWATYTQKVQEVISDLDNYYKANGKAGHFRDISANLPLKNYRGLRGYMTIMRSIFYKGFDSAGSIQKAKFSDVIKTPSPTWTDNAWSYQTPILVTQGGSIDISKFYVDEGTGTYSPYPTIIISKAGTNPLTISTSDSTRNVFNGIIISETPVEIKKDMIINGTVIIKGPEDGPDSTDNKDRKPIFKGTHAGLIVNDGAVTIKYDENVLKQVLNLNVKNHTLYRQILDALYLTNYAGGTTLSTIMEKQGLNTSEVLKYTNQSILEVDTEGIEVAIKSLKKTQ